MSQSYVGNKHKNKFNFDIDANKISLYFHIMKTYNNIDNPVSRAFSIFPSQKIAATRLSELAGYPISQQLISHWIRAGYVPAYQVELVYKATKRKIPKHLLNPKSHGTGRP